MAFIFDSILGSATANSYVDVQSSIDYFGGIYNGDKWLNLALEEQEQLLHQATIRLESETWGGQVVDTVQRLQFPRNLLVSRNYPVELYYPNTEIPKEVQTATFELGLYFLEKALGELGLADEYDQETLDEYSIGPLKIKIKSGMKVEKLPSKVIRALQAGGSNLWGGSSSTFMSAVRG